VLDERTEMMLSVANVLTAEDVDVLRSFAPAAATTPTGGAAAIEQDGFAAGEPIEQAASSLKGGASDARPEGHRKTRRNRRVSASSVPRGEYERQRTRESKVSTTCVGHEREKHEWWPVGTDLVGRMGAEVFTATVVENPQVKSGRSIRIMSGAAAGEVCRTPTRAALEATEAYRQANNLGRGGGVTNGWEFWRAKA